MNAINCELANEDEYIPFLAVAIDVIVPDASPLPFVVTHSSPLVFPLPPSTIVNVERPPDPTTESTLIIIPVSPPAVLFCNEYS